ncbi:hypothetical protein OAU50_07330 [Planctomycetota bacterium]|nr:hypothetical protein [Planctomycetota bacterium]
MSRFFIAISFTAFLAGCGMAGPGVAQVGPQPSYDSKTTFNSDWVKLDKNPNELDHEPYMGIDISEHKIGIRNRAEDLEDGADPYTPGWKRRQNKRRDARRAELKKKGGIVTMKDEQRARDGN